MSGKFINWLCSTPPPAELEQEDYDTPTVLRLKNLRAAGCRCRTPDLKADSCLLCGTKALAAERL